MFSFRNLNKVNTVIDTTNHEFISIEDKLALNGNDSSIIYPVYGIFKTDKSKIKDNEGDPITFSLILEDCYLNVPKHCNTSIKTMFEDSNYDIINEEVQSAFDNGKAGVKLTSYTKKDYEGETFYTIRWYDLA